MKSFNHKLLKRIGVSLLLTVCFAAFGAGANAQTIIALQSFEAAPPVSEFAYTNVGGAVSADAGATDTPANSRIRTGTQSFQVNNTTATLNFANFAIPSNFTGVQVVVRISSPSVNATNGTDATDTVTVATALNGGAFPTTPDITLTGFNNARYGYSTAGITTAAGTPVTGAATTAVPISTLTINIPAGTTSVALRVVAVNNNASELWNIDDVTLQANGPTAAGAVIGGRVTNSRGRGLGSVRIQLSGGALGQPIYATTSSFGFYQFAEVPAGDTYILNVSSRRYQFAQPTRVISLTGNLDDANFIGDEFGVRSLER